MRYGKASNNKQRFFCQRCQRAFIWRQPHVKRRKEKRWFEYWVVESYSIRQLCKQSGHSHSKLKRIKNYWLERLPKERIDYTDYKYLIYDGTYFHKNGCLISLMDTKTKMIIANIYAHKEGGKTVSPWFTDLRQKGLNPSYIVMDGEQTIMKAIRDIWPKAKIQAQSKDSKVSVSYPARGYALAKELSQNSCCTRVENPFRCTLGYQNYQRAGRIY